MMASLTSLGVSPRNARDWCALKTAGLCSTKSYFNSDNTECLVFERYRNSQALLDHHKNLGDTMAAILQTCSGSGEICGTPSPELIEPLKDSPVQVYKPQPKLGDLGGRRRFAARLNSGVRRRFSTN